MSPPLVIEREELDTVIEVIHREITASPPLYG